MGRFSGITPNGTPDAVVVELLTELGAASVLYQSIAREPKEISCVFGPAGWFEDISSLALTC